MDICGGLLFHLPHMLRYNCGSLLKKAISFYYFWCTIIGINKQNHLWIWFRALNELFFLHLCAGFLLMTNLGSWLWTGFYYCTEALSQSLEAVAAVSFPPSSTRFSPLDGSTVCPRLCEEEESLLPFVVPAPCPAGDSPNAHTPVIAQAKSKEGAK